MVRFILDDGNGRRKEARKIIDRTRAFCRRHKIECELIEDLWRWIREAEADADRPLLTEKR